MGLHPDQLGDFITNTFPIVRKDKWKDISLDLQHFMVTKDFLGEGKMPSEGGAYLQEQIQVRNTGTFEMTGWYGQSKTKIVDLMKTAQVPWCMARVSMAYSIYEDAWQQGPQKILSTLKVRKHSMYNDLVTGLEYQYFGTPTGPTQMPRQANGLRFWFQRGSSVQKAFGWNGGNPSGFTDTAGLDADTYTAWRNGTFLYDSFAQTDFYNKLAQATIQSHFEPPQSYAELDGGKPRYKLMTNYTVLEQFHLAQTASNDNLRMDVGKYRNTPLFRGIPIEYAPALEAASSPARDTTNPIYGIDRSQWKMIFRKGMERHLHNPMTDSNQPDVRKVYLDVQWNYMMTNRRSGFIGYQAVA